MDKVKQFSISLFCLALLIVGSILLYSCSKLAVSPIEPITYVEPTVLPQFEGHVRNAETGAAVAGAAVLINGTTQTTDTQGDFSFDAELASGAATLRVTASGFVS
ncbi:MAG: carboxypeptidase regulatory-like domain-containing protein, partial [Candidatus Hodarchaeota archaeon]